MNKTQYLYQQPSLQHPNNHLHFLSLGKRTQITQVSPPCGLTSAEADVTLVNVVEDKTESFHYRESRNQGVKVEQGMIWSPVERGLLSRTAAATSSLRRVEGIQGEDEGGRGRGQE